MDHRWKKIASLLFNEVSRCFLELELKQMTSPGPKFSTEYTGKSFKLIVSLLQVLP
jgi:hypothetical protein